MKWTIKAIDLVSRVAAWVGGTMLIASALLVCVEVVLRKAFLVSIGGADELSGYGFAIAMSWAFSFALLSRSHVRIDILYVLLPLRIRAFLDVVSLVVLGIFVALLTRYAWGILFESIQFSYRANTPLATPLWIPQLLWLSGLVFFFVTLANQLLRSSMALVKGDWFAVREVAGTRSIDDEIEAEIADHSKSQ